MSLQRESLPVYNETDTCMAIIRVFMLYENNNLAFTSVLRVLMKFIYFFYVDKHVAKAL